MCMHTNINIHKVKEKCTVESREGDSKTEYQKQWLYEQTNYEIQFPNYGPLMFEENTQSVQPELPRRTLHAWTVTTWLVGKLQVSK